MNTLPCCWSLTGTDIIHGKSIRTCEQVNQLEDFTSPVKPGSRPDHDGTAAETHLKDRMSSLVLELFCVIGKFPGRPYAAVIDVGGFWLGHLAMIRENDLVLRKNEKW
jgi:hypothetical protein